MILGGVIGSMAWQFDGGRLRIVRFSMTDNLWLVIEQGKAITTQRYSAMIKHRYPKSRATT